MTRHDFFHRNYVINYSESPILPKNCIKTRKFQQKIQMQHRVRLLETRTANKNKDTKIEQAKLGILRAEKAKTTENIHNLSGKVRLSAKFFFSAFLTSNFG